MVFDIQVDVAINLAEVFKLALQMFMMYLAYKANLHRIIPTVLATRQLLELNAQQEKVMLEGIREKIDEKLHEQHDVRKQLDDRINSESLDTKIDQVGSHIADQIIRGNEIKLLSAPKPEGKGDEGVEDGADDDIKLLNREVREEAKKVRGLLKQLDESEVKLLLDKYREKDEDEPKKKPAPRRTRR